MKNTAASIKGQGSRNDSLPLAACPFLLTVFTLWQRELVRFYRQPSRVFGALASPFIFWLVIGSGLGTSFRPGVTSEAMTYLHFFFPGTLLMILLFSAIFSTISLIEDRREGFMQSVLVAPVPRAALVLGKIFGGATLAFFQGFLFLLIGFFIGIRFSPLSFIETNLLLFLNAFALTSLGFLIAWQFQSIQGFHAVMNLFLIPLWLLSGALFPPDGATGWIRFLMKWNPLSYGLAAIRMSIFPSATSMHSPGMIFSIFVTMIFGIVLFACAVWSANQPAVRNLA